MHEAKQKSLVRLPLLSVLAVSLIVTLFQPNPSYAEVKVTAQKGPSGRALPRYVSLKADRVNVRNGPSRQHGIKWIYRRLGLPVEIVQEFEHWRQIRDSEGAEGWIFNRLLSGRRTALIAPWQKAKNKNAEEQKSAAPILIYADASKGATVTAKVEAGVIANVLSCDGAWCKISLSNLNGWIPQETLWGVYPNEKLNN